MITGTDEVNAFERINQGKQPLTKWIEFGPVEDRLRHKLLQSGDQAYDGG